MRKNLISSLLLFLCVSLNAEDFDWLKINGFGSFGASTNTCQGCEVTVISDQPDGTNEGQIELGNHFYFGLQADAEINHYLRASAQILSKKNPYSNYMPEFEWLYLAVSPAEDLTIRGGRLRTPFYMMSESMHVGFSRPFINPPYELYSMLSISYYEGADILYRYYLDSVIFDFQVAAGKSSPALLVGGEPAYSVFDKIYTANASATYENLKVRVSYIEGNIRVTTADLESLFNSLRSFGFDEAADELEEVDTKGYFASYGLEYNTEDFFVLAEWGFRKSGGFLPNSSAWYVASGVYLDKYTPYAIYSDRKQDDIYNNPFPASSPFYDSVQSVGGNDFSQTTYTLGVRYDIRENVDIKVQYDHIEADDVGLFEKIDEDFGNKPVDQITIVVDYVF